MSIIENSGLIHDLSYISELYSCRIAWMSNLGFILIIFTVVFSRLLRLLKDGPIIEKIKIALFCFALTGIVFIIISLFHGDGNSLLDANEEIPVPVAPTNNISCVSPLEIQSLLNKEGSAKICIYGDTISFAGYECMDIASLETAIKSLDLSSFDVILVDEFAEDAVFDKVLSLLNAYGIKNYRISIASEVYQR